MTTSNKFLIKTMIKCFGETKTIKLLNQLQSKSVNKKAKRYKSSMQIHTNVSQ
jgi:hypothetical protein